MFAHYPTIDRPVPIPSSLLGSRHTDGTLNAITAFRTSSWSSSRRHVDRFGTRLRHGFSRSSAHRAVITAPRPFFGDGRLPAHLGLGAGVVTSRITVAIGQWSSAASGFHSAQPRSRRRLLQRRSLQTWFMPLSDVIAAAARAGAGFFAIVCSDPRSIPSRKRAASVHLRSPPRPMLHLGELCA